MTTLKNQLIALGGAMFVALVAAEAGRAITTVENSENYRIAPGDFSGVVSLNNSKTPGVAQYCTGSLLEDRLHILTAAHCIRNERGKLLTNRVKNTAATFNLSTGFVSRPVVEFFIHPDYDGNLLKGNDIAVLKLESPAPIEAQQYDIYRGKNEVGQVFTTVGYGTIGSGNTGQEINSNLVPISVGYAGLNRFDALADVFAGSPLFARLIPNSQLLYDFDNGSAKNDAFGVHIGIDDLGLGTNEVNKADGDSGGPTFIGNSITGITSYALGDWEVFPNGPQTDIDLKLNASFGEFSAVTRVSSYASFISDAIAGNIASIKSVPEACDAISTITGALGAIFLTRYKKMRANIN